MIIVTGGAGFIGSNIVNALNQRGITSIIVVDDLTHSDKFKNIRDCQIQDYLDKEEFYSQLTEKKIFSQKIEAIFHQGACSDTTIRDGRQMMADNYQYAKQVFHFCQQSRIPLVYASSAAIYGGSKQFKEEPPYEKPLNIYGYSKYLFDQYVRTYWSQLEAPVVGLRYFNVYGPGEAHKGRMASVAYQLHQQLLAGDSVKLFEGCDGYSHGEQRRDFVYVDDVVDVNLWCLDQSISGIFNVGTGQSQTFNDVARAVIQWHGRGKIQYRPFPQDLKGYYQSFTEADITKLRQAGYQKSFRSVEAGVKAYLDKLHGNEISLHSPLKKGEVLS